MWPLTYEQTTLVAQATERRADDMDAQADLVHREVCGSAPADREANVARIKRGAMLRARAAELRACADKLWTFRRQLPAAPLTMHPNLEG